MRCRFTLLLLLFLLFPAPGAHAQKRVFATVNPNADVYNGSADLYNPHSGVFSQTAGGLNVPREGHVAVRLANGNVLIAGGYDNHYMQHAEMYLPSSGTFTPVEGMVSTRSNAAAIVLANGTVFVAGGYNGTYLRTAEIFEPVAGRFSLLGVQMSMARQDPALARLENGNVLISGGFNGAFINTAERYDPIGREFVSVGGMGVARWGHTATTLSNGKVLIAGGCNNTQSSEAVCDNFLDSAELYDPVTETFTFTGAMTAARRGHTATLLADGRVLLAGGRDASGALGSAEIYDPQTGTFTPAGPMAEARTEHTASILPGGHVLIAGGRGTAYLASGEVFNPGALTFTPVYSPMAAVRAGHSATVLADGRVLLAGGRGEDALTFDVNIQSPTDNVAPDIVMIDDSLGLVPYTGSGVIVAFSPATGEVKGKIRTGGKPAPIVSYADGRKLAAVSVLDNRIFIVDVNSLTHEATYTFSGSFGFGSRLALSPDETTGYVSSTATGEVIKFSLATGAELGRLQGLSAPAQITLTGDGRTLMIVDTVAENVVIADAASMVVRARFNPLTKYAAANFTIFNRVVLNAEETIALITSQDGNAALQPVSAAFIFDPATGAFIEDDDDDDGDGSTTDPDEDEGDDGVYGVGYLPGHTVLLPGGKAWAVLTQTTLSLVPTADPRVDDPLEADDDLHDPDSSVFHYAIAGGAPLASANILVSPDGRYAYYTSATTDRVFQHDLVSGAVVGSYRVGDYPNLTTDQPSTIMFTPDRSVLAVLNFASNELDLLTDQAVFRQTRFVSQQDRFTGLSVVNLSNAPAEIRITALTNNGLEYTDGTENIVNPAMVVLAPNAQKTVDVSELFNLDNNISSSGYLLLESDQPFLAGYSATGQVQGGMLNAYVRNMEGIPLFSGFSRLHDWILPEIPQARDSSAEFVFLNPGYNASTYSVTHYGTDGIEIETRAGQSLNGSNLLARPLSEMVSSTTSGQVLITGGFAGSRTRTASDIFDAGFTGYTSTGNILTPRQGHQSVLLPNGGVLVTGGKNGFFILKTAEIYSPVSGMFEPAPGSMHYERYRHTATALSNGKVLLAGGQNSVSINRTAELYDPVNNNFAYTAGLMNLPRDAHTATRLADGRVLLVGGLDGVAATATAEIYDPSTDTFSWTGSMNTARAFHTAVLLKDGTVMVAGGYNGTTLDSVEIYDPQSGTFAPTASLTTPRSSHTATLLSDGTVLVAGGQNDSSGATGGLETAELYDPSTGLFLPTNGSMTAYRSFHTATLLFDDAHGTDGRVILAGGYGRSLDVSDADEGSVQAMATADLYDPATRLFTKMTAVMSVSRQGHSAVLLAEGVAAGYLRAKSAVGLLATEVYSNGGATTALHGIDMNRYAGVKRIYSPRFVLSPERTTLLNVINGNQERAAAITLTLYGAGGQALAALERILAPNAQLKGNLWDIFMNDSGLRNQEGWLEVASSTDRVVGTVSFTDTGNRVLSAFELSGHPLNGFIYPLVSEDADFYTEISLLNSGEQAADISLELWGVEGTLKATRAVTLAAGTSQSGTIAEWFTGVGALPSGNVRIRSSQPVHAMGELGDRQLRFITSVPPVALPVP